MGFGVTLKCDSCKYEMSVAVGCGLFNLKQNWMPALDKQLNEIVAIDTRATVDENFIPYTDLVLNKKPFFRKTPTYLEWSGDYLLTKYNYCPKCTKFKLRIFKDGLLWD